MLQFNRFPKVEYFNCDACQKQFQQKTAYSIAQDWEEFDNLPTFCFNCTKIIQKANRPPKLDKRTLNKTGRTHQLGTRVRKDFLKKLKAIARKQKLKYVEVLERALECYEREAKTIQAKSKI